MPYYPKKEMEQKGGRRIWIVFHKNTVNSLCRTDQNAKDLGWRSIIDVERKLLLDMYEFLQMYALLFEKVLGMQVRLADQLQEVKDCVRNREYQKHNHQAGLCCPSAGESCEEKDRAWAVQ